MANTAAQNLQALLAVTGLPAQPTAKELRERTQVSRSEAAAEDADFAAPQAVATAVASSFILGPVGGILLGLSQGILGKRMEQGELDRAAAEANVLADADEIVRATFDEQRTTLTSDLDHQQLNTLESQYNAARKLMDSPFEDTRNKGMALMAETLQAQREFDVRQEEQAIAASLADEEVKRAIGQEGFERYKFGIQRFTKESEGFLAVSQASNNVLQAMQLDSPVGQMAAIKLLEKALDPTSVVRPEEQQAYGEMGSLFQQLSARSNLLQTGQPLLPAQVEEIQDLVLSIDQVATDFQREREARFANENEDMNLPGKYRDNFNLVNMSLQEQISHDVAKAFLSDKLGRNVSDEEVSEFWKDVKDFAVDESITVEGVALLGATASMALEAEMTKWIAGGALAGLGLFGGTDLAQNVLNRNFRRGHTVQHDPKGKGALKLRVQETASKAGRIVRGVFKWAGRLGLAGLTVDAARFLDQQFPLEEGFDETATRAKFGLPLPEQKRPTN